MRKTRVLYISHYSLLYGANKSLLNLLSGLTHNIDPIVIIPKKGPLRNELKKLGLKYYIIPFYPIPNKIDRNIIKRSLDLLKSIINILSVIIISIIAKMNKIEIIHSNSILVRIGLPIAKISSAKHVWHVRETKEANGYNLKCPLIKQIENLHKSDKVIFISEFIKQYYFKNELSNGVVIYNGVVKQKQITNHFHREQFLMFCGAINELKRVNDVILGFSNISNQYPDYKLFIAGSGSQKYLTSLKEKTVSLGISEKVVFTGFVNNTLIMMTKAFALIMPSYAEPMGRVTIEAMSQGCPVIGFDGGATSELIINNKSGFLYKTIDEMSLAIIRIIEDEEVRAKMILNAIHEVKNKFTEETFASNVLAVYKQLLK